MKIKHLLGLVTILFLSGTVFAEQDVTLKSLNQDQLTQILKGKTLTVGPGSYIKHKYVPQTVKVYYGEDGTLKGKIVDPQKDQLQYDTGTWTVNSDGLQCNEWKNWGKFCMYFYKLKDHYVVMDKNQDELVAFSDDRITEGNTISK